MAARRAEMEKRGIQPAPGKSVYQMDADELWKTGLSHLTGAAAGDVAGRTEGGRRAHWVGAQIADKVVKPLRNAPGVSQIANAERVTLGMLGGRDKLRQVAQEALSAGVGQLKDKAIDYAKTRGVAVVRRLMSAAKGGRVMRGGDVRVHKRELIVPARRAMPLMAALRKSKIAVPMRALKGK